MTALYPSTSAAQVFVPIPVRLSTTGGSAPITPDEAPIGTPADFTLVVKDSANTTVVSAALNALPGTVSYTAQVGGDVLQLNASLFTVAGVYLVGLVYTADADYQPVTTSFQWGGWVDTLLGDVASTKALATTTEALATSTELLVSAPSYWATNRVDVDDVAAPTELILYDSDGTTPLATRTIANADGSAVNPAQVLRLGALVPVP